MTNENSLEKLTKILLEDENKFARMKAAISISKLGDDAKDGIPALIQALEEDESSRIREEAAKALGKVGKGNNKVAIALVDAMIEDLSENVRVYAAESMGEIGEVAVPALLDVLRKESNIEVKEKAIDAIGFIGSWAREEAPDLINSLIIEIIQSLSRNPVEKLHRVASEAILKMGEAAIKPLIKEYKTSTNSDVSREIEITLEKLAEKLGYRNRQALIRSYDSD